MHNYTIHISTIIKTHNKHRAGSILFETNFIITQLAIRLTSTFRPPSAAFFRNCQTTQKPQINTGASKRQSGRQTQDRLCVPNYM